MINFFCLSRIQTHYKLLYLCVVRKLRFSYQAFDKIFFTPKFSQTMVYIIHTLTGSSTDTITHNVNSVHSLSLQLYCFILHFNDSTNNYISLNVFIYSNT